MYPPNSDGAVVPLDAEGGAGGEQHVGAGVGRVPHLPHVILCNVSRVSLCHVSHCVTCHTVSRVTHRLRHVCVLPVAAVGGHHGVP